MWWEFRCTKMVIELGLSIWKYRNKLLHGKTIEDARLKAREAILRRVQKVYESPPSLLSQFPAVREISLESRVQKPTGQLAQWLRRVEQQVKIS